MSNPEGKDSQKLLSPSERMTEAWIKMIKANQVKLYINMGSVEIEKLTKEEPQSNGYENIADYLRAVQDLIALQLKEK